MVPYHLLPLLIFAAIGSLWASVAPSLHAQTLHWDAGLGFWSIESNWSPEQVPNSGTDVHIDNGGVAGISNFAAEVRDLYVGYDGANLSALNLVQGGTLHGDNTSIGTNQTGNGYIAVDGAGSTLTTNGTFHVGERGDGLLLIQGGGAIYGDGIAYIGRETGSEGAVTVTGAGSTWESNDLFYVGDSGAGELVISDGGMVTTGSHSTFVARQGGSSGTVTVTGQDSAWIVPNTAFIGYNGMGEITISDGGSVTSHWGILGGWPSTSTGVGTATISGENSLWTANSIYVGDSSEGYLFMEDGGRIDSVTGIIGTVTNGHGQVVMTGEETEWDYSSGMHVGWFGEGELTVEAGASAAGQTATVGHYSSATGSVTVTGSGSEWVNSTDLSIGREGTGTLSIEDGAMVGSGTGYIGRMGSSEGVVTLTGEGSAWQTGNLYVGGAESGAAGQGTLSIHGGAVVHIEDDLFIRETGTVNLHGGTLRLDGYERAAGATVDYTTGTLQLGGDRTMGTDSVIIDFFGNDPVIAANRALVIEGNAQVENSSVEILSDASVVVGQTLAIGETGIVRLHGGTLEVGEFGDFSRLDFQVGTVHVTGPGGASLSSTLQLSANTLLEVDSTLSLETGAMLYVGHAFVAGDVGVDDGAQLVLGIENYDFGAGLTNEGDVVFLVASTVTDPVMNAGRITAVADVTFDGSVAGPGDFFGAGSVTFNGEYSPGSSPGLASFESDVGFGENATLLMELGGLMPGDEYDQLFIGGQLTLDGHLEILQWNNFMPSAGDAFQLFDFAAIQGNFSSISAFALAEGLEWDFSDLEAYGTLSVIPEPSALPLLLAGLAILSATRSRPSRSL